MERKIRRAKPGDDDRLALLDYTAGYSPFGISIYDIMVPGPPGPTGERIGFLGKLLGTETVSWMHRSHYHVVEVDSAVAASLGSYTSEEANDRLLGRAMMEAGWTLDDLNGLVKRMEPFSRVEPAPPPGAWVLENAACFEEYRRQGHVTALFENAIEEGRALGREFAQLGVVIGNEPAIKAYTRLGFEIADEYRDPDFEKAVHAPGMYRMVYKY
jgi:ribosomal protein S18 acetylase RimI-like enzyme